MSVFCYFSEGDGEVVAQLRFSKCPALAVTEDFLKNAACKSEKGTFDRQRNSSESDPWLCLSSSSQGITGYCCACLLQDRELQVTDQFKSS